MTTKEIPDYLKPKEVTDPTARVIYEPPLAVGTVIRLWRFQSSTCAEPGDETVAIAGFGEWEEKEFNDATGQHEPTGRMIPYAFSLWETEQPPSIGDWGQFHKYCEAEGIEDPDAFLQTEAGKTWLTGGHKVGDRRCFEIGRGLFHSALIGDEWIPVLHETVRTKTQPVLGWAASNRQAAFRKRDAGENGHRGVARRKDGRWERESDVERRRWTTTLDVRALAELDRISADTGEHRNQIVERLILGALEGTPAPEPAEQDDPEYSLTPAEIRAKQAQEVADLAANREQIRAAHIEWQKRFDQPATATAAATEPVADITPEELTVAIYRLCVQHGDKWPRGMAQALSVRAGISKQAVASRKKTALKALAQAEQGAH